jgi:hypothetical protein
LNKQLQFGKYLLPAFASLAVAGSLTAQTPSASSTGVKPENQQTDEYGRPSTRTSKNEALLPTGPAPRTAQGHPDLSGYWQPNRKEQPIGNLGKDYPNFKLPFTAAGEVALKYNLEHTIDPESLCIVGGLPRHNASGLGFQLVQGADHAVFLYGYTTYRLVPFDGRKHSDDPDPSFFGEEIGSWDGDTFVIDSIGFKEKKTWADENANPHSDDQTVVERWTRPDIAHLHLEMVVTDPKYYKDPVHYQRTWLIGKAGQEVHEYSCAEDNVDAPHLGPGPGPIGADGKRGYEKLAPLPPPPSKDHPAVTSIPPN